MNGDEMLMMTSALYKTNMLSRILSASSLKQQSAGGTCDL